MLWDQRRLPERVESRGWKVGWVGEDVCGRASSREAGHATRDGGTRLVHELRGEEGEVEVSDATTALKRKKLEKRKRNKMKQQPRRDNSPVKRGGGVEGAWAMGWVVVVVVVRREDKQENAAGRGDAQQRELEQNTARPDSLPAVALVAQSRNAPTKHRRLLLPLRQRATVGPQRLWRLRC
jgi:hypothetical protein